MRLKRLVPAGFVALVLTYLYAPIAVIVLVASSNRLEALLPLVPELERALAGPLNPGVVLHVRA